jgi:hypothetical protein
MAKIVTGKAANFGILAAVFIGVALAPLVFAQGSRQLQVEVGPNQQVKILARDVSYGEVLRDLQGKLGWEIDIPPLADELKVSYSLVEAKQPQDALAKLLAGSRLGYAFTRGTKGSRILKVLVIPSTEREGEATEDTISIAPTPANPAADNSSLIPAGVEAATTAPPSAAGAESSMPQRPAAASKIPLSEAANAIGVPAGVSPADVGRMKTFSTSDAAQIMGVPPGVSPSDVGRTTTLPNSNAVKIIGGPAGTSPDSVGKTKTLPLPTGPGPRP